MPSARRSERKDAFAQAEVDRKTAQRELERSRKAYELGSYTELQALKAEDALEKAQFASAQAKLSYEAQPRQNRFDIDSRKALYDRQEYLVEDLKRQVASSTCAHRLMARSDRLEIADRSSIAKDTPASDRRRSLRARGRDQNN